MHALLKLCRSSIMTCEAKQLLHVALPPTGALLHRNRASSNPKAYLSIRANRLHAFLDK